MEAVARPQSIALLVDDQIQLTIEYITKLLALMRDDGLRPSFVASHSHLLLADSRGHFGAVSHSF
jgi:hypothetical protein